MLISGSTIPFYLSINPPKRNDYFYSFSSLIDIKTFSSVINKVYLSSITQVESSFLISCWKWSSIRSGWFFKPTFRWFFWMSTTKSRERKAIVNGIRTWITTTKGLIVKTHQQNQFKSLNHKTQKISENRNWKKVFSISHTFDIHFDFVYNFQSSDGLAYSKSRLFPTIPFPSDWKFVKNQF